MEYSVGRQWFLLAILFSISACNYADRYVVAVLLEPIKREFHASDTLLGLLTGFSFSVFYVVFGVPLARLADRGNRKAVINASLLAWSVLTICCGLTRTFWQLVALRVGVGVGEAGAIPASQSLAVDYFSMQRRALALAILTAAGTAGYFLAFSIGGTVAVRYGWRMAFVAVGVPGLILTLASSLFLDEPRKRIRSDFRPPEAFRECFAHLAGNKAFLLAIVALSVYFVFAYGVLIFSTSYLMRVAEIELSRASFRSGLVMSASSLLGAVAGGWLADLLAKRETRWLGYLPSLGCTIAFPLMILAFSTSNLNRFSLYLFAGNALLAGALPAVYTAVHGICGKYRRATAIALMAFAATLVGGGLGPLATGAISDLLVHDVGKFSLRYAILLMSTPLLVSGALFYLFGRLIPLHLDLEEK